MISIASLQAEVRAITARLCERGYIRCIGIDADGEARYEATDLGREALSWGDVA